MSDLTPNLAELHLAIEDLYAKRRALPMLILVYSGIDALSALARSPGEASRDAFARWVDRYMIPSGRLPCSGPELYGARCGVLHTFAAESSLSRAGKVRQISYAWGTATSADLAEAAARLGYDFVSVHIDDLLAAFRGGTLAFLDEIENDPTLRARVDSSASIWFATLPVDTLRAYLVRSHRTDA